MKHFAAAFGKPQALISEEALAEKNADGHIIELSPKFEGSSGGLYKFT